MDREKRALQAEKIRTQYAEKDAAEREMDRLRELDARVKRPANIFAYGFGTAASLVMGTGMCLAMEVVGKKKQIPGIIIGVAGMAMMGANYPIYKKILNSQKEKYSKEILKLSEKIINME